MKDIVTDFGQFSALRHADTVDNPETLQKVADQFETLFLQSLLKSMRDATPGDPIFGQSGQSELYQSMFDSQLSADLAEGPGFGLSELLVRQLGGSDPAAVSKPREANDENIAKSPPQFARKVWPYATRAAAELGTTPKAVLAQAALETGWGQHTPKHEDGRDSHNYFGIKAGSSWGGETVTRATLEFRDGVAVRENHKFRSYPSISAAFSDYSALLSGNDRYAAALNNKDDVGAFGRGLSEGGYATDPEYADKLEKLVASPGFKAALERLGTGGLSASDSLVATEVRP